MTSDPMTYQPEPDPENPILEAQRPIATGEYLITFREETKRSVQSELLRSRVPGELHVAGSMDGVAGVPSGDALLLEDIGVAVVSESHVAGMASTMISLGNEDEVLEARPAYYLFALTPPFQDTSLTTWGIDAVGASRSSWTGKGMKIAVLDTGFNSAHPDFQGRTIVSRDFTRSATGPGDVQGHGTHCMGTAGGPLAGNGIPRYGVAHAADLYVGKVLGDNGSGSEVDILAGMRWAIANKCEVISMSLGRSVRPGEGPSPLYERFGQLALSSGCLIVAAAGNDSARASGYIAPVGAPANSPSIMAVAAVDQKLLPAYFSNGTVNRAGGAIDIAGPGVNVFSSFPQPRNYRTLGGTSMACPHVAGVAALWAQSDPALRGQALWDALVRNARAIPSIPPRDVGVGLVQSPPDAATA